MKRYYIKYLPIKSPLKRGSYLKDDIGNIQTVGGDEKSITAAKYSVGRDIVEHVYPFICYDEIAIGDMNCFKPNGLYLGDCIGKDLYRFLGKFENAIKVIGQVSKENINLLPGLIVLEKNLVEVKEETHLGYSMLKVFKIV